MISTGKARVGQVGSGSGSFGQFLLGYWQAEEFVAQAPPAELIARNWVLIQVADEVLKCSGWNAMPSLWQNALSVRPDPLKVQPVALYHGERGFEVEVTPVARGHSLQRHWIRLGRKRRHLPEQRFNAGG